MIDPIPFAGYVKEHDSDFANAPVQLLVVVGSKAITVQGLYEEEYQDVNAWATPTIKARGCNPNAKH